MRTAKLLLLDLVAGVVLLVLASSVAALVQSRRPDCYACGTTLGITIWYIVFFSLQPALWARTPARSRRLLAWCLGSLAGLIGYLLMKQIVAFVFHSGKVALTAGASASAIAPFVGVGVCILLLRRFRQLTIDQSQRPGDLLEKDDAGMGKRQSQERLVRLRSEGLITQMEFTALGGLEDAEKR